MAAAEQQAPPPPVQPFARNLVHAISKRQKPGRGRVRFI
jgi:hypothetical protein